MVFLHLILSYQPYLYLNLLDIQFFLISFPEIGLVLKIHLPIVRTSGIPPQLVETTGTPSAIDSRTTFAIPSDKLGSK